MRCTAILCAILGFAAANALLEPPPLQKKKGGKEIKQKDLNKAFEANEMNPRKFHRFLEEYESAGNANNDCSGLKSILHGYRFWHVSPTNEKRKKSIGLREFLADCEAEGPFRRKMVQWKYVSDLMPEAAIVWKMTNKRSKNPLRKEFHMMTTFRSTKPREITVTDYPQYDDDSTPLPDPVARYYRAYTMSMTEGLYPKCVDFDSIINKPSFRYVLPGVPKLTSTFLFKNGGCRLFLQGFTHYKVEPMHYFTYADDGDTAVFFNLMQKPKFKAMQQIQGITTFPRLVRKDDKEHALIHHIHVFMPPETVTGTAREQ